ncbi:uncharacterized protein SPAPADRAFT_59358 [Spathaspora passalidarum NRRL Y-27907]|uniref:Uncharacterized protein n=1 Tax=Spathaspora passalidarum (strain NRRL Y-27907 / 11-Y1) TaxID=619300 RepID=G3AJQ4_SPAPN|nr:uncharacterized protein SPAPADRAFT_59358 [Spathaspora passalidarum NRRL Y-27907]EGW33955.1 hypothetical protein SPAPADRAFT_59358 [Spathaspora passalidarum NRRL Y-27907]
MTFVNTKQLKLIEESVTNHVKFYDKTISQYLKLRQEIYSLSKDSTLLQVHQLKVELDKIGHIYQLHLQELSNILSIKPVAHADDINYQYEQLLEKETLLQERINNIRTIQQPILSKIQTLVNSFEQNIDSTKTRYISNRMLKEQDDRSIDYTSLIVTKEKLNSLVSEVDIDIDVTSYKIFEKYSDTEFLYRLNKSNLREFTHEMTVDDYEQLIESTLDQITTLQQEGAALESSWNNNANKIELIKHALDSTI